MSSKGFANEHIVRDFADICRQSTVGKKLPQALYVHVFALSALDLQLQQVESQARELAKSVLQGFTLVKFSHDRRKISYLDYPDFDTDPHPMLHASVQVDLDSHEIQQRDYRHSPNPPILHRKETFVTPAYPLYQEFVELTRQEEAIGLLRDTRTIGTRNGWQQHLQEFRVTIAGHRVISLEPERQQQFQPKIDRHKAAIRRPDLSKPVRLALEAGLLAEGMTFFDYGCGYGEDIQRLRDRGFASAGWDPFYRPNGDRVSADIVNLGYVINVIESQAERREALLKAWELSRHVLLVSAQVLVADVGQGYLAYSDGVVSSRNTFQKYYEQEELKIYIDRILEVDAVPVALGIYFVFRDAARAQNFRASRFHSRAATPRVRVTSRRFEEYRELLAPLMSFFTERGRLPVAEELPAFQPLIAEFGTVRHAFHVIVQATNRDEWDAIADKRRQDILVFLALSNFDNPFKRLKLSQLSPEYQHDIKSLFGTYQAACATADLMLFNLGKPGFIATCCHNTKIGRLDDHALYVHLSALDRLDTMLRLYEGCASRTIGRMDGATLIKFHLHKPKIAYQFYPDFDDNPHPKMHASMQIDLRDLHVRYRDYRSAENPPVLHRKDAYVMPDYPSFDKFAKLTKQEENWGLLDDMKGISHWLGWQQALQEHGAELRGHRVVWRKNTAPDMIKLLKARHKSRSSNVTE